MFLPYYLCFFQLSFRSSAIPKNLTVCTLCPCKLMSIKLFFTILPWLNSIPNVVMHLIEIPNFSSILTLYSTVFVAVPIILEKTESNNSYTIRDGPLSAVLQFSLHGL